MKNILHIDSSGRRAPSVSRQLSNQIVNKLSDEQTKTTYRDVSQGLPFLDEQMIGAYYTPKQERSPEQHQAIQVSDAIVDELKTADILVIGVPLYNFSAPAGFKAWADLAARAGETFNYTETGPEGLLVGKKAYVVVTSGGIEVGSDADFLTPWIRHFLGFIGIHHVEIVNAGSISINAAVAMERAQTSIASVQA